VGRRGVRVLRPCSANIVCALEYLEVHVTELALELHAHGDVGEPGADDSDFCVWVGRGGHDGE